MTYSDKRQKLKKMLEQKESHTVASLEAGVEITNSFEGEDEEWKDWYWSDLAKALSKLGEYDKATHVANSIEHKIEKAETFMTIATDLMTANQWAKAVIALNYSEVAAFDIAGEDYEKWQRAGVMAILGKQYEILGEHVRAQAIWKEAIASAQIAQNTDNPQEIHDCSSVLSEITTYLIEAGLIDLAKETAQSIRNSGRRQGALSRVANSDERKFI
jgi:tetratricopeptide (TPR) repeat protein